MISNTGKCNTSKADLGGHRLFCALVFWKVLKTTLHFTLFVVWHDNRKDKNTYLAISIKCGSDLGPILPGFFTILFLLRFFWIPVSEES